MGNPDNAMGGRGMGEGETAVFTVPPELAYGARGHVAWGVPPDATLQLRVTLIQYALLTTLLP